MPCACRSADYADDTDDDCVLPASLRIFIQNLMAFKHDKMSQRKKSQTIWSRFEDRLSIIVVVLFLVVDDYKICITASNVIIASTVCS